MKPIFDCTITSLHTSYIPTLDHDPCQQGQRIRQKVDRDGEDIRGRVRVRVIKHSGSGKGLHTGPTFFRLDHFWHSMFKASSATPDLLVS